MDVLHNQSHFASLSVRDLLDARDLYHVHLLNKENVVGTAIGRYLIRKADAWPSKDHRRVVRNANAKRNERTLSNSEVRPYSWPCLLVMVRQWEQPSAFGKGRLQAHDMVPKSLYLPDGRVVPVCVVRVEPSEPASGSMPHWAWPEAPIGGGFPMLVRSQEIERKATVGCMVTDGHTLYALTNRHVCGEPGSIVHARVREGVQPVGMASKRQLTRELFSTVYPSFAGTRTYLNLDVGLLEVDDARDWTSDVFGLGEIGALADLNEQNLGLQLIDCPVRAFGAVTGLLEGQIKALFYRYKSVGGYDYVSDLLIAPAKDSQGTRPGDSGTVWHLRVEDSQAGKVRYHPLAIEWGAQAFSVEGSTYNFALATNLSNVCKLLDVELVSGHNTTARPFWGATGHYSIGAAAVDVVKDTKLAKLLSVNAQRISFDGKTIESDGGVNEALKEAKFVPLADVPDVIWKKVPADVKGGRDTTRNAGPEHPTHYADIDVENGKGKTLRQLCMADLTRVNVPYWQAFYDDTGATASKKRGCLPFRVWQFFDEMVTFVEQKDYASFVTAAGLLAHYVGDACQPLHGSHLADGYEDQAVEGFTKTGKPKKEWPAKGVHSIYETRMIDDYAEPLFEKIDALLSKAGPKLPKVNTGQEAAQAIVQLMDAVAHMIPPATICDAYVDLGEGSSKAVVASLWKKFGEKTAAVMALGIRNLANIWESAWLVGAGDKAALGSMKEFTEAEIRKRYTNATFVRSLDLNALAKVLVAPDAAATSSVAKKTTAKKMVVEKVARKPARKVLNKVQKKPTRTVPARTAAKRAA